VCATAKDRPGEWLDYSCWGEVILALGTFATQTLLETKLSIGKLRGQIHRYHGVPLIVTYHPAALLRNPSWKRPTWEDVQLARRGLDRAAGA
jgi:DNA polymerase